MIITTGGSEALLMSFLTIMDPDDEVIIPEPFYANYNGFAKNVGVKVKPIYSSIETGFALPDIAEFEKAITLKVVDQYWMEHISTMSHLREGIGLRGYGQTNPLQAYTMEGYELFDSLISRINKDVSIYLLKSEIRQNTERKEVVKKVILPDEKTLLEQEMINMCDNLNVNLLLTTGGTGFSKRDITPEATKSVIEREALGIVEAIRFYSLQITKRAMLSRATSGIRKNTLIINLPGSPKACKEALDFVLADVKHGIEILLGEAKECARK